MNRVGIDTNVLLRLIVDDDPVQREAVKRFGAKLNRELRGVITLVSLLEMDWALRSQYEYGRKASVEAIRKIVHVRGIDVESHDVVVQALRLVESDNVDFADALLCGRSLETGCSSVVTLDRKAASRIPGMELLA